MNWTREKPKEAGWYWWRDVDKRGKVRFCVCQEVYLLHGSLFAADCGYLDKLDGEWLGPITPADRQQGRVEGLIRGAQLVRWHKSCTFEADPAFALERAAKDIESVASQIIQPQQAQEAKGVGE